jgi:flagellar hook protein FlgE
MSLLGAMRAGVAGLQAQSVKFGAIADNISNSSTVGYKRASVEFTTMVTEPATQTSYTAGGVLPAVRQEVSKAGSLLTSSSATDIAISGRGFFVVSNNTNNPGATYSMTRAGSFSPDLNGNLVNSAGYYLQGFALNPDGTPIVANPSRDTFADLTTVNVANLGFAGSATKTIDFAANLPAQLTGTGAPTAPIETPITYYDALGNSRRMTLQWTPDTATANQWQLNVIDYTGANIGTVDYVFNDASTGALAGSPASITTALPFANGVATLTTVDGQPVELKLGDINSFSGMVQFAGDYSPNRINSDGAQIGQLQRVEIDKSGIVYAIFNNGQRTPVYQIPIADVPNPGGLTTDDGNIFRLSKDSGSLRLWDAGKGPSGEVVAGALEASNVDIAEELTELIQTQRAYSSNAKIFQAGDEMMTELTNLKR